MAAKECSNIYAPLANRLGIGQLKWELEDYCFRYLHPEQYRNIAKLLHERRLDREQYIADFVTELTGYLKKISTRLRFTAVLSIFIAFGENAKETFGVQWLI